METVFRVVGYVVAYLIVAAIIGHWAGQYFKTLSEIDPRE